MSMRERIARAMYEVSPFKETEGGYDAQSDLYKRGCMLLADAALNALTYTDPSMDVAGVVYLRQHPSDASGCFATMIEEAKKC